MRLVSSLALALVLSTHAACAVDETAPTASISIPLVQPVGSDLYRLRDATFEITAPDMTVQAIDGDVEDDSIVVPAVPGAYSIRLVPGWTLERVAADGTATAVEAIVGNQNPQLVHVFPDADFEVSFRFYVRSASGTLTIGFGVVPAPQKIFGTLSFATATGVLEPYAGKTVDYVVYFDGQQQSVEVAPDGTRSRHYLATGVGAEFLHDPIGVFATAIAAQAAGGTIDMRVSARPDGSAELVGAVITFTGLPLQFGPATVDVPLDATGTPADADFSAVAPWSLTAPTSTAAGTTTVIHTID